MNDTDALQGLWRIDSSSSLGAATHYLIRGNSMLELVPNMVSDGKLRATFFLDESTSPRRLTEVLDFNGPDGPPDPNAITLRYLYQLDGDTLVLCQGAGGAFPTSICDQYPIKTLIRDFGPIPQTRQPSGTRPIVDEDLGTLRWDDNCSWYSGEVELPTQAFQLILFPSEETDANLSLVRAKQVIANLSHYRGLADDFAVDGLLGLKNCEWLDDDAGETPVSPEEFKSRMALDSITVKPDSSVEFSYLDGGLFLGHMITVCFNSRDACTETHF